MVFEKPEVVDKAGWWAQQYTTFHDSGMTDTDDVAVLLHARPTHDMLAVPPLHSRQHVYDKLAQYCNYSLLYYIVQLLMHWTVNCVSIEE